MNKYISRITSSARGEVFNPLMWPFLLATFFYGIGFTFFLPWTNAVGTSSMFAAMAALSPTAPIIWGIIALLTILGGLTFLLFNIPPFGKVSGIVGFCLWLFGGVCYIFVGDYLVLLSVALPNAIFWFWQYLSLSVFRAEDARDKHVMEQYRDDDIDGMSSDPEPH